jgi:hypothetical protein
MEGSTIVWIIVAIIVIGGVIAFVMSRSGGRRAAAERAQAEEMREKAAVHDRQLRERETSAAEVQARSEMARVEAQKRELEAERLAAEAEERSATAAAVRRERDEQLRLADLRDPDVRTDEHGYRVDEQGNRIGDGDVAYDDATTPGHLGGTPAERRADSIDERTTDRVAYEDREGDRVGDRDDRLGDRDDRLADGEADRVRTTDDDDVADARDERDVARPQHRDV